MTSWKLDMNDVMPLVLYMATSKLLSVMAVLDLSLKYFKTVSSLKWYEMQTRLTTTAAA